MIPSSQPSLANQMVGWHRIGERGKGKWRDEEKEDFKILILMLLILVT